MAYAFRQNALSTHKYLRKFIAKSKSIFEDMKKSVKLVEVYEDYEFLDSEIQEQPKEPASKSEQHLKQEELIIDEVTEPEYELAEVVEEVNIADQEMAENVITDQYFDEIYEVEEEVLESNQETAESLVTEEIEEIIEDDDLFNEDTKSTLGNRDKDMSMSDSDGGILQCDECQKQFKTKTNLKVHKKLHTGDKPFACEYCQKRFATKGVLKQHVYIHTGEKPYQCEHCDRSFTQSKSLVAHKRRHTGEKPYPCPHCELHFRTRDALRAHCAVKHSEIKPTYVCLYCHKVLSTKHSLELHLHQVHKKDPVDMD